MSSCGVRLIASLKLDEEMNFGKCFSTGKKIEGYSSTRIMNTMTLTLHLMLNEGEGVTCPINCDKTYILSKLGKLGRTHNTREKGTANNFLKDQVHFEY